MKEAIKLKNDGRKFNILGDHQQLKLSGSETNGQFLSVFQDNPPATQIPLHVHEN